MSRTALSLVALLFAASPARAQIADHLSCYKVRDPQAKATYTADVGGLVEPAEAGCTIKVPAVMACVPATKSNVSPTPQGGGGTGTPNAFGCYKIKCRKTTLPAVQLNDQFGSRSVVPVTGKLLCAPAATAPCGSTFPSCNGDCPPGSTCLNNATPPECLCFENTTTTSSTTTTT
jgi:hypothetical protein